MLIFDPALIKGRNSPVGSRFMVCRQREKLVLDSSSRRSSSPSKNPICLSLAIFFNG
jgi:hypothetical protein